MPPAPSSSSADTARRPSRGSAASPRSRRPRSIGCSRRRRASSRPSSTRRSPATTSRFRSRNAAHVRSLLDATRPEDSLARLAAVSVDINTRTAPIYRILVSAASSDTEVAAILDELTRQRQEGQGRVADGAGANEGAAPRPASAGRRRRHPRPRLSRALPPARHRPCVVSRAVRAMARGSARRPAAPVDARPC